MKKERPVPVAGTLSKGERIFALIWLPIHILVIPTALMLLFPTMGMTELNLWYFVISAAALLLVCMRGLRRDFDPLCERPWFCFITVLKGFGAIYAANLAVSLLLMLFTDELVNPNEAAVDELMGMDFNKMAAAIIFLAPLAEELMFRGGVFGAVRTKSRRAAYIVSALLFAAFHVWSYALEDPMSLIYVLQYIPAGLALAWCYDKTGSIWGSIFLHMLNNGVSVLAMKWAGDLM